MLCHVDILLSDEDVVTQQQSATTGNILPGQDRLDLDLGWNEQ